MAQLYVAGFDTALIGAMTVSVNRAAAGAVTATVTPGTYCHLTLAACPDTSASVYTEFAAAVAAALEAAVPLGVWTCTWSAATGYYTIGCDAAFTLTWTGTGGTNLRLALGYISTPTASATSAVGTVRPYYLMIAEVDGLSEVSGVYEPDEVASEAVSDGGQAFSVSKDTDELWSDWSQAMEPLAATFTRSATAAVPWTWQAFFKHCRAEQPFVSINTADDGTAHRLRADGASFAPSRVATDYDGLWNLRFLTRDLGTV
jgi:hypothetical protein